MLSQSPEPHCLSHQGVITSVMHIQHTCTHIINASHCFWYCAVCCLYVAGSLLLMEQNQGSGDHAQIKTYSMNWSHKAAWKHVGFVVSGITVRIVLQKLYLLLMELSQTPTPGHREAEDRSREGKAFMSPTVASQDQSPSAPKGGILPSLPFLIQIPETMMKKLALYWSERDGG